MKIRHELFQGAPNRGSDDVMQVRNLPRKMRPRRIKVTESNRIKAEIIVDDSSDTDGSSLREDSVWKRGKYKGRSRANVEDTKVRPAKSRHRETGT